MEWCVGRMVVVGKNCGSSGVHQRMVVVVMLLMVVLVVFGKEWWQW